MAKQIISLIDGVIKKKLEDIVLDIMNHPEDVPEDIIDAAKIAAELGYSEINLGINEIFNEVGKIQIERTIQKRARKRERELKERQFQDYLIDNPGRIEDIEKGLKVLGPEKRIRSGILDIDALDEKGDKVRIELKAVDYDSIATHVKIEKYLYEDDTKKARVFFAAPEVKPDLFFSLRDPQEQGKVRFFEYDFDFENQTYCTFKEIKANDFEEPKNIPWDKIKRKKEENGLIRVTTAVGKPERKIKRKSLEAKRISKEIFDDELDFQLERLSSLPFYFRVLIVTRPNLAKEKANERYLQPMIVERDIIEGLEELINSNGLTLALENFKNNKDYFISHNEAKEFLKNKNICFPQSVDTIKRGLLKTSIYNKNSLAILKKIFDLITQIDIRKPQIYYDELNLKIKEFQKDMDSLIRGKERDRDISSFKEVIEDLFLKGGIYPFKGEEARKYLGSLLSSANFYPEKMINEFLKIKQKRVDKLIKIDPELGNSYLCFNLILIKNLLKSGRNLLKSGRKTGISLIGEINLDADLDSCHVDITPPLIYGFINKDQELYQSILSIFKTKEEPSKLEQIAQETPEAQNALTKTTYETPTQEIKSKAEHRKTKIHYGYPVSAVVPNKVYEMLPQNEQAIVNEFVEGVLNNPGYSGNARKKYANLARESKWYNKRMDEERVRDFFANLTKDIDREDNRNKTKNK